jgi:hypothetical protein
LIDRWTKLGRWLDENERDAEFLARLRVAAQQWEATGQAEGLLWRDRAAEDARTWHERCRAEQDGNPRIGLGKREERYLLAVATLAEHARRLRRRLVMVVMATLGAIAFVVSYLAIRADRQAMRAVQQAMRAEQQAMRGPEVVDRDPILHAHRAQDRAPPRVRSYSPGRPRALPAPRSRGPGDPLRARALRACALFPVFAARSARQPASNQCSLSRVAQLADGVEGVAGDTQRRRSR